MEEIRRKKLEEHVKTILNNSKIPEKKTKKTNKITKKLIEVPSLASIPDTEYVVTEIIHEGKIYYYDTMNNVIDNNLKIVGIYRNNRVILF